MATISRLNLDGTDDSTFTNNEISDPTTVFILPDDTIRVMGGFQTPNPYIVKLTVDGDLLIEYRASPSSAPNSVIYVGG